MATQPSGGCGDELGVGPGEAEPGSVSTTDRRLLRGARTRRLVLRAAVDVASVDGLNGVSFGRLATATGVSKAGIQTLFSTKEALQLSTAARAREMFVEAVITPAGSAPRGVGRLRALIECWLEYASAPLFEGGCFWTATVPEHDSRPGPVRDALLAHHVEWLSLLEREVAEAVAVGELAPQDPELLAFQVDAVLRATDLALRREDDDALTRTHRIVDALLADPR